MLEAVIRTWPEMAYDDRYPHSLNTDQIDVARVHRESGYFHNGFGT